MMRRSLAVLLMGVFLPGSVIADSKFYWGMYLGEGDPSPYSAEPITLDFKLGREFGKYIALEIHTSLGAEETQDIFEKSNVKAVGGYVRLNLPLQRVNLYAFGGQSRVEYDVPGLVLLDDDGNQIDGDSDRSGGIGIDLFASEDSMLTIEKVIYNYDNQLEYNVLHIGFTHRFNFGGLR